MFASTRIVLVLTAVIAANLSKETVTKERLAEKDFPIRVLVSPAAFHREMVSLRFEFDHGNAGDSEWAAVELIVKEPTSNKKIAVVPVEFRRDGDERKTIAKIDVDVEFALSCDVVISRWHGSSEHEFHIPLKLFADEMKDEQKAAKK